MRVTIFLNDPRDLQRVIATIQQQDRRFEVHTSREKHTACPRRVLSRHSRSGNCAGRSIKRNVASCRVGSLHDGLIYNAGHCCRFITPACLFYGRYGPRYASDPSSSSIREPFVPCSFDQLFLRMYVLYFVLPLPPVIFPHGPRTRLHAPLERGQNALLALSRWPASTAFVSRSPCLRSIDRHTLSHCTEEF